MKITTDISRGYPCGHHVSATYVTSEPVDRDTLDTYRCDTCGIPFGVLIAEDAPL